MIVPKQYGGKGFSAHGHSQVVQMISTRSGSAAGTVTVPNSLGPGELLMRYGFYLYHTILFYTMLFIILHSIIC